MCRNLWSIIKDCKKWFWMAIDLKMNIGIKFKNNFKKNYIIIAHWNYGKIKNPYAHFSPPKFFQQKMLKVT